MSSNAAGRVDGQRGRVERMIEVIRVLERERKITKERLFSMLEVSSQSSFKRTKAEFARAGLPLKYEKDDGYYHIPPNASIARYGIDARTRAQLAQVRASISALGGAVEDALDEVLAVLEARVALDDPDAVAVVSSRHPQPRAGAAFWNALDRALTAVRAHRWLSFRYTPTGGGNAQHRTLQPYAVHAHDGRYYVWGVLEGETVPKFFVLDRMDDVSIEEDTFVPDAGLSLDDVLRHSFGTMAGDGAVHRVVVRVLPEAAAHARCRRWPAEVDACDEADGSLRLTFEVTALAEIVAWALSFGGSATIESPEAAVGALREAAQRALDAAGPRFRPSKNG